MDVAAVASLILSLVSIWSPRSPGSPRSLETVYRRSKRLYGNSDGKLRDDRGDRDDRDRPDRTLLYPGDRDDRVKFTCDHMETVNRPDRLHTISSDRGHWGDRGDYMETRLYCVLSSVRLRTSVVHCFVFCSGVFRPNLWRCHSEPFLPFLWL